MSSNPHTMKDRNGVEFGVRAIFQSAEGNENSERIRCIDILWSSGTGQNIGKFEHAGELHIVGPREWSLSQKSLDSAMWEVQS